MKSFARTQVLLRFKFSNFKIRDPYFIKFNHFNFTNMVKIKSENKRNRYLTEEQLMESLAKNIKNVAFDDLEEIIKNFDNSILSNGIFIQKTQQFTKNFQLFSKYLVINLMKFSEKESFENYSNFLLYYKKFLQSSLKNTFIDKHLLSSLLSFHIDILESNMAINFDEFSHDLCEILSEFIVSQGYNLYNNSEFIIDITEFLIIITNKFKSIDNGLLTNTVCDIINSFLAKNQNDIQILKPVIEYLSDIFLHQGTYIQIPIRNITIPFTSLGLSVLDPFFNNEDLFYRYLMILKNLIKQSYNNKPAIDQICSYLFYLREIFERNPDRVKNFDTKLIVHIIYMYNYVYFELSQNLYDELGRRIDEIMKAFSTQKIMMITSSLITNPNHILFEKIMRDERLNVESTRSFMIKHICNIGFNIASARFDNLFLWEKFFRKFENHIEKLNSFDARQMIEILFNLKLIGPNYEELFHKYIKIYLNRFEQVREKKRPSKISNFIWTNSDGEGIGVIESYIHKALTHMNIEFEFQREIEGVFLCDFIINKNIILMANGSQHYRMNDLFTENWKNKLKKEVFQSLGYKVIGINCVELSANEYKIESVVSFLKNLLKMNLAEDEFRKIFIDKNQINKL